MKNLILQLPDGAPAPATDFGNVAPGTSTSIHELRLVNTGDEAIPAVQMKVTQDGALPGLYVVTANGQALTDEWAEVLSAPLEPGAFIAITEAWQVPAAATQTGLDNAYFDWQFLR